MSNTSNDVTTAQAAGNPQAQAATSEVQATESSPNQPSTDDLLKQISELRRENAQHRKRNQEQEAASKAEIERKLKEQGEYQKLAEQHEARVRELEPVHERYTTLSSLVNDQIKQEIKDWPATVKALDPGEDAPIEQRLAWRNKARAIVGDLQQQARATMPGNVPNPRPAGGNKQQNIEELQSRYRQKGTYGF